MKIFMFILTNNILPIFILIILGYILNKKFDLDTQTLSRLSFYIFVPSFTFVNLYTTEIPSEMFKVVAIAVSILIVNMLVTFIVTRMCGYDKGLRNAFVNSTLFFNSGNIGIPLITLVYSSVPFLVNGQTPYLEIALTTQVIILVTQNITLNTLGFINAGRASTTWRESVFKVLKMPTIYVVPLIFILKAISYDVTNTIIWPALNYSKDALISTALLTLGIQLSKTSFKINSKEVYLSAMIRLLGGPILALLFILLFQMKGVIAQVIMISSAAPTAVNTALIAVEYDNYPDFASQAVITSTSFAAVSLVLVIYIARVIFPV